MINIVVVGLGEMGASLAEILNTQSNNYVVGVDINEQSLRYAIENNLVSATSSQLRDVAPQADVIVLATPVTSIEKNMHQLAKMVLKENVIITDTGSTKRDIMAVAEEVLTPMNITFIGGHAMAGTHQSGVTYANKHLYKHVTYFLVPSSMSDSRRLQTVFKPLDAKFITIDIVKHDALMAIISDVPHVVAFALMNTATAQLGQATLFGQYVAGGFKDTTRIAASDSKLWADVLLSNKQAVLESQKQLIKQLNFFSQAIENNDEDALITLISDARQSRENL
ncbi:prephenate dehydrogenase/arogenate dehydrogenase family protein [Leuconostoc gelidum subsp. gelidum]|uniref:Prephenate dehydrogenase/arogenate dehydrogenase family protein n=1 Tax=Leuconostoc gelidum subsp. gelidum TaxID=1607839 RepID=A0AB35G0V2_LEUGE|nr:prephenate dehydrogenase/arogenate dehydrogenase family protein [Leuconostoc gelidum]MBZ5963673.1 prephenate dehydrogenase/arogenate dehydrogenase family protein [Leuconostoc gelidum subsp. gelidum]MBZ5975484.1 prephenate dehydrogenase/arogenate dehydrogenase family protein [Leuconostoc gelidum subsp. gelidum]MBZ5976345.1 prephenate dehydrogenase/arogenate dehydrogenase family protein [Leuconostoc gelidum subsp. gelidum]MBZ5987130.1 prephenate dehydrogenase/arogenate dehydrogenase family pro